MVGASQGFSMDNLTLPIGKVRGVPIRVHFLLPLVAGLAAMSAAAAGAGLLGVASAVLVSGPLLLLTVLCHELGHVVAARSCGFSPDHILLWPLGGLAYISKDGITPKQQIFVSLMGPATHIPMLAMWAGIMFFTNDGHITLSTAWMTYETHFIPVICIAMLTNNIAMLLFNLLVPCIPLDCSQILVSLLLLCGCEANTAAKVMVVVSVPVVCILIGLGVWAFVAGVTSASASLNIMLALWLGVQTYRLHQARVQGNLSAVPLFATAMKQQATADVAASAGSTPAARPSGGGGGFKPFEGTGHVLGRPTNNEVCVASVLALAISMAITVQVGSPPSL